MKTFESVEEGVIVKSSVHPPGSLLKGGDGWERIDEVRWLTGGRKTQPWVAPLRMSHWALNRPPPDRRARGLAP